MAASGRRKDICRAADTANEEGNFRCMKFNKESVSNTNPNCAHKQLPVIADNGTCICILLAVLVIERLWQRTYRRVFIPGRMPLNRTG